MDILIRGARIITQNANQEILEGDVLIEGNKIARIGKGLSGEGVGEVLEGKGKIIFPGLVNAHTHGAMGLLRGYGEGLPLHRWLEEKIWPAEKNLTTEDVYWGTVMGAIEMVRSGTTCFNEMYMFGIRHMADAVSEVGMRAVLGKGVYDKPDSRSVESEMKELREKVKEIKGKYPRVQIGVAAHSVYACSEELLREAKGFANQAGLLFHMHVSETRGEVFDLLREKNMRPVEYLDSIGLVDAGSVLAHMGWVTKREISIAGKNKASVVHCPVSNMKLATGGICPVSEFEDAGANIALGTDGAASNNSLDMVESMKYALLLQTHKYWDAERYPVEKAWDAATINGANALGLNAGSIEEGKLADLVFVDGKSVNLAPLHNDLRSIVYSLNPGNITDVMVDGEFVLRNGEIVLLDEQEAIENATEVAHDLVGR
ncbi:amidohydrolase family protein [Candidatus Micrarchaeota archaeon]|nr:amidohydrolase family protein [Candidatus Micrarchaeota archaeon]MBD3418394.1 amidohydrolase family protein [Candidatus Micrarchaeota archaeon]